MGTNEFSLLESRLLGLGGERAVMLPDPPPGVLLERGRVFATFGRRRVRGRRHDAHTNAAMHYLLRRHFGRVGACHLATGYALFDGLWCGHSWCWHANGVLETAGRPSMYYGIILDADEAARFVWRQAARVLLSGPIVSSNISCNVS